MVGQSADQRILPAGKFGLELQPRPDFSMIARLQPDDLSDDIQEFVLIHADAQNQHVAGAEAVAGEQHGASPGGGILHDRRDGGLTIAGGLTSYARAERNPVFTGVVTQSHRSDGRSGCEAGKRANLFPEYRHPGARDFDRFIENTDSA